MNRFPVRDFLLYKSRCFGSPAKGKERRGFPERELFYNHPLIGEDYLKSKKWPNHKKRRTVQKLLPRKEL